MVHQIDAKVVILYDVSLDSYAPVSAPLPLLVRGLPSNSRQGSETADSQSSTYGGTIYGDGWNFLIPDLICDAENGLLWRLHLDLEVINCNILFDYSIFVVNTFSLTYIAITGYCC